MQKLSFSQRMGIKSAEVVIQVDQLDSETRMDIWNSFYIWFNAMTSGYSRVDILSVSAKETCIRIWSHYLRRDLSQLTYCEQIERIVKGMFLDLSIPWYEVFDFCEKVIQDWPFGKDFSKSLNSIFENDNVGYRIIGGQISPITNKTEIQSIESALALGGPFAGARIHIQSALEKYSDRISPDYRNCIKEAISAVESMCQVLTGKPKATLGAGLKALEKGGVGIHTALAAGFEKIYGYTSDQDGIRHAILDETKTVEQEDALFMLVSCSAFCNYLQQKAVKAGIVK